MSRGVGFGFAPWYWQAMGFAVLGGITLYKVAMSNARWYWWFLPAAAWFGFAWAVVTRTPE